MYTSRKYLDLDKHITMILWPLLSFQNSASYDPLRNTLVWKKKMGHKMNSELCNQKICKVLTANFDCNSNNLSTKSAFQITKYNV